MDAAAELAVMEWFRSLNKPATLQGVVDALQSKFSKTLVQRALDSSAAGGLLKVKEVKKAKFYFLPQEGLAGMSREAAAQAQQELGESYDNLLLLEQEARTLGAELRLLEAWRSVDDIVDHCARLEADVAALSKRAEAATDTSGGQHLHVDRAAIANLRQEAKEARKLQMLVRDVVHALQSGAASA